MTKNASLFTLVIVVLSWSITIWGLEKDLPRVLIVALVIGFLVTIIEIGRITKANISSSLKIINGAGFSLWAALMIVIIMPTSVIDLEYYLSSRWESYELVRWVDGSDYPFDRIFLGVILLFIFGVGLSIILAWRRRMVRLQGHSSIKYLVQLIILLILSTVIISWLVYPFVSMPIQLD